MTRQTIVEAGMIGFVSVAWSHSNLPVRRNG